MDIDGGYCTGVFYCGALLCGREDLEWMGKSKVGNVMHYILPYANRIIDSTFFFWMEVH